MWTLRCTLENSVHNSSSFITLTYGQEHLPDKESVSKNDAQAFLKRLAVNTSRLSTAERIHHQIHPAYPRYYLIGEYGSQLERPHYHALLFGYGTGAQSFLESTWQKGHVNSKPFAIERAAYVARYTQKKSFWPAKPSDGRAPEFAIMSKRPGLGHGALAPVADTLKRHKPWETDGFSGTIRLSNNLESLWAHGVPECLRQNGNIYPLGPYLVDQLIAMIPDLPQRKTALFNLATKNAEVKTSLIESTYLQEKSDLKSQGIQSRQNMKRGLHGPQKA